MSKALILTYNRFPEGDAGAVRQFSFAKILIELGYGVFVAGMGAYTGEGFFQYKGVEYTSFRNKNNNFASRLSNFFGYKGKLQRLLDSSGPFDLLLVIDLPYNAMRCAENYAKKQGSVLIHDSVEWYSADEFKLKQLSPEYFRNNLKNRFFFKQPWRVVGISSFLTKYFSQKGLKVTRIPVILVMDGLKLEKKCEPGKTLIVYAGAPGGKDSFDQILLALEQLQGVEQLELRILGVTEQQFISSMGIEAERWNRLKSVVHCKGRVPRDEVLRNLKEADYTILLRDAEQRYAKAGFPTKVPESLSMGTPVICNLSSDLGMYLRDGENSIIVKSSAAKDIAEAIQRAAAYSLAERERMRQEAFHTAAQCFDYHLFIPTFEALIR